MDELTKKNLIALKILSSRISDLRGESTIAQRKINDVLSEIHKLEDQINVNQTALNGYNEYKKNVDLEIQALTDSATLMGNLKEAERIINEESAEFDSFH